jgi:plastocyanin
MRIIISLLLMANAAFAATHTVSMIINQFSPADLTINVGDTVVWRCDAGTHDTVSGSRGVSDGTWRSPFLSAGQTFSFTFTQDRDYEYYCTPHWFQFNMVGIIRVRPPNGPPTVSITSPPDQATFSAPADIILEASASDAEGDAVTVEFFMNGSSLGTIDAPPYRRIINDLGGGNYTFRAVATDSANATADASVSITVTNPPAGTPPAFITQPQSQAVLAGTNVTFSAAASGSSPLVWQWFFNLSPVPDATNSILELTNVQPAHAGEYFVTVSNAFGSATSSNATLTVTVPLFPAKNDFNHDGQTDFLWHHKDGRVILWLMDGVNRVAALQLRNGRPAPLGARIIGTHDFDFDSNVDILWQHADASLRIWFTTGTDFLRSEVISPTPTLGRSWQAVGLGDFNGDLHADILFRHSEGYLLLWYMKGKGFSRQQLVYNGKAISQRWRVAGAADINNNGYPDILWQKSSSAMVVWFMTNQIAAPVTGPLLSHLPRVDARVVGLNDLNQDGHVDFIWRDPQGRFFVWWMNQTNTFGSFPINHGQPVSSSLRFAAPRN